MKVTTNKGVVTITSENNEEAIALFTYSLKKTDLVIPPISKKALIACDACGKRCVGKKGLMIHKASRHGYVANHKESNRVWREKARVEKAEKEMKSIWN
jgi:hypothetical protein